MNVNKKGWKNENQIKKTTFQRKKIMSEMADLIIELTTKIYRLEEENKQFHEKYDKVLNENCDYFELINELKGTIKELEEKVGLVEYVKKMAPTDEQTIGREHLGCNRDPEVYRRYGPAAEKPQKDAPDQDPVVFQTQF